MRTKFKIVMLGSSGVGKTSIMNRFVNGTFYDYIDTTIGALFFNIKQYAHNGKMIDMQIWDTAGQERYKSLIPMYSRSADVIIIVYDIHDVNIADIKFWCRFVLSTFNTNDMPLVYLVGNKSDIVEIEDAYSKKKEILDSLDCTQITISDHIVTSAKHGINVDNLFNKITANLVEIHCKEEEKENTDKYPNNNPPVVDINKNEKYDWYSYQAYTKNKYCCW